MIKKDITEELLFEIGFRRISDGVLGWGHEFEIGERIDITLIFEEDNWAICDIKCAGKKTEELFDIYYQNRNIQEVVEFVWHHSYKCYLRETMEKLFPGQLDLLW